MRDYPCRVCIPPPLLRFDSYVVSSMEMDAIEKTLGALMFTPVNLSMNEP
jgi:hypothetical protein